MPLAVDLRFEIPDPKKYTQIMLKAILPKNYVNV